MQANIESKSYRNIDIYILSLDDHILQWQNWGKGIIWLTENIYYLALYRNSMKHLLYKHIKSSLWLDSLENKQISNKTLPRQTHLEEKK